MMLAVPERLLVLWWLLPAAVLLVFAAVRTVTQTRRLGEHQPVILRAILTLTGLALCLVAACDLRWTTGSTAARPSDERPRELMIVVDGSRSMDAGRRADLAAAVVRRFGTRWSGRIGLTVIGDEPERVQPLGRRRDRLRSFTADQLAAAAVGDGSNLPLGLADAAVALPLRTDAGAAPQSVLLVTDGETHGIDLTPVVAALRNDGRQVAAVIVGRLNSPQTIPDGDGLLRVDDEIVRTTATTHAVAAAGFDPVLTADRDRGVAAAVDRLTSLWRPDGISEPPASQGRPLDRWLLLMALLCWGLRGLSPGRVLAVGLAGRRMIRSRASVAALLVTVLSGQTAPLGGGSDGLFNAALAHADRGEWVDAAAEFERFADATGDAASWFNAGRCWTEAARTRDPRGRLETALRCYGQAIAARPDWDAARINLQLTHRLLKQSGGDDDDSQDDSDGNNEQEGENESDQDDSDQGGGSTQPDGSGEANREGPTAQEWLNQATGRRDTPPPNDVGDRGEQRQAGSRGRPDAPTPPW